MINNNLQLCAEFFGVAASLILMKRKKKNRTKKNRPQTDDEQNILNQPPKTLVQNGLSSAAMGLENSGAVYLILSQNLHRVIRS